MDMVLTAPIGVPDATLEACVRGFRLRRAPITMDIRDRRSYRTCPIDLGRKLVAVGPGQTAITWTPRPLSSNFSASLKWRTNAFAAAYVAIWGSGWNAELDARLMMPPVPRETILAPKACDSPTSACTLTWVLASSSARS